MSIATTTGDAGTTGLIGNRRVSKGSLRIEALGDIDALGTHLAFARSVCPDADIRLLIQEVQRQLFALAESVATDPLSPNPAPTLDPAMVAALTAHVHRYESFDGILVDWALPGDDMPAAACEQARAVCRRAERSVVRLVDAGEPVDTIALSYLNRLADLLWLCGRFLERASSTDSRLRNDSHEGPRWSRAW